MVRQIIDGTHFPNHDQGRGRDCAKSKTGSSFDLHGYRLRGRRGACGIRLDAPELFEKGMNALEGSNASRSAANAIDYFRRLSDLGFATAQVVLGYLYEPDAPSPQ